VSHTAHFGHGMADGASPRCAPKRRASMGFSETHRDAGRALQAAFALVTTLFAEGQGFEPWRNITAP